MATVVEWIVSVSVSLAVIATTIIGYKISKMLYDKMHLPPGPFPLPYFGNLLSFRCNKFAHEVMNDMASVHGPVFSLFMGHDASVVVTDAGLALQVLKKQSFSGRPHLDFLDYFFTDGSSAVMFADLGKTWEALRKVVHTAARKFASSPQVEPMMTDVVDRVIDEVGEREFTADADTVFSTTVMTAMIQSVFGVKYDLNDPDYVRWRQSWEDRQASIGILMLVTFAPFLKYVYRTSWMRFMDIIEYQKKYIKIMFDRCVTAYTDGKNDSFCDAMIAANREAESSDSWTSAHLTNENIYNCVFDVIVAGSDTTKHTLTWIFLLMSKYPLMQDRMRAEVDQSEDRDNRPFVAAFIAECMRYRPIVPSGVPHKTISDECLNGHRIPRGTTVMISLYCVLHDKGTWGDADAFRPERFLKADGTFESMPNQMFIPFSTGRRSCPGNKLASNELFLIVSRFLQRTQSIEVVGGVTDDLIAGDRMRTDAWIPKPYNLKLKLKQTTP